jgi:hypothetical protein
MMTYRYTRRTTSLATAVFAALLLLPVTSFGQSFRGGINGTVTDQLGAAVSGAQVTAVETSTNAFYKSASSSAGEFAFSNLPLGEYSVTIAAQGFSTEKVNKIIVTAGANYILPVKLKVSSTAQTVEVTANALALDTGYRYPGDCLARGGV